MKRKFNSSLKLPIISNHSSIITNESVITSLATLESYVVTGSIDGTIKFNSIKKDNSDSVECVKTYNAAHLNKPVKQLLFNGSKLASFAENDKHINIFDLNTLDMIQTIELPFIPSVSTSYSNSWYTDDKLIVSSQDNELYCIYLDEDKEANAFAKIKNLHKFPIVSICFNPKYKCFISVDEKGLIEICDPQTYEIPESVEFKMKSSTQLFYFRKNKLIIDHMVLSPDGEMFACGYDKGIKVFSIKSGKIVYLVNSDRVPNSTILLTENSILYSTQKGIEVFDLAQGETEIIGSDEELGFIYFGILHNSDTGIITSEMITSNNAIINSKLNHKPILVASTLNSNEIHIFGDSQSPETAQPIKKQANYTKVTLHTSRGDIKIELYPKLTPKTVENFITLCKRSYYNNVIFHRVIPEFMIQTGDPKGDGTGGESCWGGYFKDEFTKELSHDKYMVSMANAGPNTNGSQFFITTEDVPFLDNKHTVFGKVISGTDVVKSIEDVETDEDDKPFDRIVILSTTLER